MNLCTGYTPFTGICYDPNKTRYIVIGAPLDMSSSYRSGSGEAPEAIRRISKSLELCSIMTGVDVESVGIADVGDAPLIPGNLEDSLGAIMRFAASFISTGKLPIVLGGEHTISFATLSAVKGSYGKGVCMAVFDAHLDLRNEYLGSTVNHATVMRRIIEAINPIKVVYVGSRAVSREEAEFLEKMKGSIAVASMKTLLSSGIHETAKRLADEVSVCDAVYLSIDVDVVDPAFAPGVQTPEPVGLTPREVLELLEYIVDSKLVGVDIVEVAPKYDPSEITAALAARFVVEIVGMHISNSSENFSICNVGWGQPIGGSAKKAAYRG